LESFLVAGATVTTRWVSKRQLVFFILFAFQQGLSVLHKLGQDKQPNLDIIGREFNIHRRFQIKFRKKRVWQSIEKALLLVDKLRSYFWAYLGERQENQN
jgi:hypothetical protein